MIYVIHSDAIKSNAKQLIDRLPCDGSKVVIIKDKKRSDEASALFHALCHEVAAQKQYAGKTLKPEQWKVLFVSGHAMATGLGAEVVPGLEGEYVNIRESTASMSISRMNSLISYVQAWCAENEVKLCGF